MKLFEEKEKKNKYYAMYDCGNNLFKLVLADKRKHTGFLEIQKIGLEPILENVEFEKCGIATHYNQIYRNCSSMGFLDENETELKKLMKKYASEFRTIFKFNKKLKIYLPEFKQMTKYID